MVVPVPGPLKVDSLFVELPRADRLVMTGSVANPAIQAQLARYLESVHAHVADKRLTAFAVDVKGLTFVNSSAIRVFVDWISRAQGAGYKLVFHVDRSITWHRLSFSVLKSLAPSHVEVTEASPTGAA